MAPLALLDTVIVKKYNGVDPTIWRTKELAWIQTTRALPAAPPSVGQLFFQVLYNKEVQCSRTVCLTWAAALQIDTLLLNNIRDELNKAKGRLDWNTHTHLHLFATMKELSIVENQ